MASSQEWLDENAGRSFPFVAPAAGVADALPHDFLVDLRVFLSAREEYPAYLKTVAYDEGVDIYTLTFGDPADSSTLFYGSCFREAAGGAPRQRIVIGSGASVAIGAPGASWHDPSWGGAGDWTITFTPSQTLIEQARSHTGPRTLKRLMILGGTDPLSGTTPADSTYAVVGGYNLDIGAPGGDRVYPGTIPDVFTTIVLSAVPGGGDGYEPRTPVEEDFIRTLGGQAPDNRGNIVLQAHDCVRISQPLLGGVTPLANTLQLESDCLPCCGCSNYRNVKAALERKSSKISSMNAELEDIYTEAVAQYDQVVLYLGHRARLVVDPAGVIT